MLAWVAGLGGAGELSCEAAMGDVLVGEVLVGEVGLLFDSCYGRGAGWQGGAGVRQLLPYGSTAAWLLHFGQLFFFLAFGSHYRSFWMP